jgi:flagellar basal-body rod protein FlgB
MSGDLPIFSALKAKLHWNQSRQKLLAENVANADSVGYKPRDLKDFSKTYAAASLVHSSVQPSITSAMHIGAGQGDGGFLPLKGADYETVPSGNSVSLEDQMTKLAENQMDYQSAITLYTKSMNYLKIALGKGK